MAKSIVVFVVAVGIVNFPVGNPKLFAAAPLNIGNRLVQEHLLPGVPASSIPPRANTPPSSFVSLREKVTATTAKPTAAAAADRRHLQEEEETDKDVRVAHYSKDVAGIIPLNRHITDGELLHKLSFAVIPGLVKKYNIPVQVSAGEPVCVPTLEGSRKVQKGCYVALYLCDEQYTGECFWAFKRLCKCTTFAGLKVRECNIKTQRLPLPESLNGSAAAVQLPAGLDYLEFPVGECVTAVWVWCALAVSAIVAFVIGGTVAAYVAIHRMF